MPRYQLARSVDIVVQASGNEFLIYDLNTNKAFCLNETSSLVWQYCDGKHSVPDIAGEIGKRLKTSVSEDLVWLALDQFNKDGLLDDGKMVTDHFAGVSRRELIRKAGFASMIALPLVSSIIAPKAIAAQSTCPNPGCTPGCVAAGDDLCGGCIQNQIQFRDWTSNDGSCTGTFNTFITGGCMSGGPSTAANDREVLVCF